eukprot:scaffold421367_cov62-Attheya_sp.AAC.3
MLMPPADANSLTSAYSITQEPFSVNSNVVGACVAYFNLCRDGFAAAGRLINRAANRLLTTTKATYNCTRARSGHHLLSKKCHKSIKRAINMNMNMNASTANVLAKNSTTMTMISSSGAPNARIPGVSKATRLPLLVAVIVVLFVVPGAHGHGHEQRLLSVKKSKNSKNSKSMTSTTVDRCPGGDIELIGGKLLCVSDERGDIIIMLRV